MYSFYKYSSFTLSNYKNYAAFHSFICRHIVNAADIATSIL